VTLASEPGVTYVLSKTRLTHQAATDWCDSTYSGATMAIHRTATAKEELRTQMRIFLGSDQTSWLAYQVEVGERGQGALG
jgi:hypothetical protein